MDNMQQFIGEVGNMRQRRFSFSQDATRPTEAEIAGQSYTDYMEQYANELEQMRLTKTPEYKEIQGTEAEIAAEEGQAQQQRIDEYLKTTNIETTGPSRETYDYQGMVADGGSLMADPEKGVRLPNRYTKPYQKMVAGFDLASGQKIFDEVLDPMGIAREGVEMLRKSYNDTTFGSPVDDLNGLSRIAYAVLDQGGGFADFADSVDPIWTEDHKKLSYRAAAQAKLRLDLEKFYQDQKTNPTIEPFNIAAIQGKLGQVGAVTLPPDILETIQPTDNGPIDPDSLPANQKWLNAARDLYSGLKGREFQGSNEDLSDWALSSMGFFNWNIASQAYYTTRAITGDTKLRKSMLDLMNMYDRTGASWGGLGRASKGIATDPTTYLGLGIGKVVEEVAGVAAKTVLKRLLVSGLSTAVGMAVEGGLSSGLDETMRQTIELEGGEREAMDLKKIATRGGEGAAFSAILGSGLGALKPKIVKEFGHNMIDKAQVRWREIASSVYSGATREAAR
jgi:hypothetical protein